MTDRQIQQVCMLALLVIAFCVVYANIKGWGSW